MIQRTPSLKYFCTAISVLAFVVLFVAPFSAQAQFKPLVPDMPLLVVDADNNDFVDLLQALIGISVGVAAALAVVMVALGGFEYMTTDSAFKIGNAKERIKDAILGLLIVLTAVLLLRTINPNLINFNVFRGIEAGQALPLQTGAGGGGAPATGGLPGAPGTPGTFETPGGAGGTCVAGCTWNGTGCTCPTDDLGPPPAPAPPPAVGGGGTTPPNADAL